MRFSCDADYQGSPFFFDISVNESSGLAIDTSVNLEGGSNLAHRKTIL